MNIHNPLPRQLAQLEALWQEAFGDGREQTQLFFNTAFRPERSLCIELDGSIVAALYWMDCADGCGKLAYLYAIATAAAHRGKGLCRALMEKTHGLLAQQGYSGAVLVPAEESLFSFYERLGYKELPCMDTLRCTAQEAIHLRQLEPEEFYRARNALLPAGGVVQEDLSYLAGFAGLYAGEGFTCVASPQGKTLLCAELLGERSAAAGITAALGCDEGIFRVPGSGRHAMFKPLVRRPAPAYFGLAFD